MAVIVKTTKNSTYQYRASAIEGKETVFSRWAL